MTVDKAALLTPHLGSDKYEIPGFGVVRIRGLSIDEVREMRKLGNESEQERHMQMIRTNKIQIKAA